MKLSQKEIGVVRLALHLASEWEETVIESQIHVDWLKSSTNISKRNIKDFRKLSKRLFEEIEPRDLIR